MSICIRAVSTRMPAHDARQVRGSFVRAALEQLGVRGDRTQRSPKLVRRIGDEPAQLLLGLRRAAANASSMRPSIVLSEVAEPADLGPVVLRAPAGSGRRPRCSTPSSRCRAAGAVRGGPARGPTPIAATSAAPVTTSSIRKSWCSVRSASSSGSATSSIAPPGSSSARTRNFGPGTLGVDREVADVVRAVEAGDAGREPRDRRSRTHRGSGRSATGSLVRRPAARRRHPGAAAARAAWSVASWKNCDDGSSVCLKYRLVIGSVGGVEAAVDPIDQERLAARRRSRSRRRAARRARRPRPPRAAARATRSGGGARRGGIVARWARRTPRNQTSVSRRV